MSRKLFKTKFLHGANCYWMKRSHPDHPCHKPHIGEVYCLYDKGEGWGFAVFNVLRVNGGFFVRSIYHINREVWAHTEFNNSLLEFGYIYRHGGLINYGGNGDLPLGSWQMSFRFDPNLQCEVKLSRHTIETIDFHPDASLLKRFQGEFPRIITPCLEAIDINVPYVPLDYAPYVPDTVRTILEDIRPVFIRKRCFSPEGSFNLTNKAKDLVHATLKTYNEQVYPRLFEAQKLALNKFIEDPLSCFESRPDFDDLKKWLGIAGTDLKRYFKQRHNLSYAQFIKQAWIEQVIHRLISDPNESIESIAYDLGWGSAGNLCNDFKEITGLSPSEYRRKYRPAK